MFSVTSYWSFAGVLYLIYYSYLDIKNKMVVPEKYNYLMTGITISLYSHFNTSFLYAIALIIVIILFNVIIKKIDKTTGKNDKDTLSWIILGYGIINPLVAVTFAVWFSILYIIYALVKVCLLRFNKLPLNTPTPFYIVILLSYGINCFLYSLF